MVRALKNFLQWDAAGGVMLFIATIAALICANTGLQDAYVGFFEGTQLEIRAGDYGLEKPLVLWINDGLMAVFFLLVGLELKRELLEGELSNRKKVVFPAIGAIGGVAVPAVFYAAVNWGDPVAMRGWAIPAATDIAFALGILSLLGPRVPLALKLFLVTLAIIDDIAAILIIALFYSEQLSGVALAVAAIAMAHLLLLNRMRVVYISTYILIGLVLWVATLKAGVHATLAGVVLAFFIPMRHPKDKKKSPLLDLEHSLSFTVSFGILPVFAFANAGVPLGGITLGELFSGVPLGIALGLFLGKQVGVFGFSWLAVKGGLAEKPKEMSWGGLHGLSLLAGVGFTMSLFINSLAFEGHPEVGAPARLGILLGTALSALVGVLVLHLALPRREATKPQTEAPGPDPKES